MKTTKWCYNRTYVSFEFAIWSQNKHLYILLSLTRNLNSCCHFDSHHNSRMICKKKRARPCVLCFSNSWLSLSGSVMKVQSCGMRFCESVGDQQCLFFSMAKALWFLALKAITKWWGAIIPRPSSSTWPMKM